MATGGVAITAVGFIEFIPDINRMNEFCYARTGRNVLLGLAENIVADLAVLGNDLAVGGLVLVVVAAETAGSIEVTDVVRVRVPLDLHRREIVPLVNVFYAVNGLVDGRTLLLRDFRVVFGIIGRNFFGNGCKGLFFIFVWSFEYFDSHFFDERE